jgi:hypothetical protein
VTCATASMLFAAHLGSALSQKAQELIDKEKNKENNQLRDSYSTV